MMERIYHAKCRQARRSSALFTRPNHSTHAAFRETACTQNSHELRSITAVECYGLSATSADASVVREQNAYATCSLR